MGFFLLIALICGVVSATGCTKSSCAQLQVVYETYGSLSTGSPVEVTVGRNVWLSTDASSKRVASHFDFVEPGKVNVAVKNIPSPSTSRMECIDLTASTGGKTFSQSSSISLSAVAGHQFQCTVRVFGARISTGKREAAPPVNADVSIVKGGSNSSEVGSPTLYQFTLAITNAGVNDAQNLVVTDLVDPRLTIRNINAPPLLDGTLVNCPIPTNPIGPVYDNNVTCTFPSLKANLTATITIQYLAPSKVTAGFNPIINNTANVISTTFDSDLANNQNSHIVQLVVIADLRASLNGPQNVTAGNTDNVFYTMTVCNNGLSNALNVFGNWTLPSSNDMVIVGNVVPISSLGVPQTAPQFGSCTVNGQFIRCTLPELNNTQCQSYRAEVNIPSTAQGPLGGIVNMNATVGSDIQDLDLNNNFATLPVQILVIANLRITKSGDLVATAGDDIGGRFSIVVTNAGPSMAYGVVMTDAVPVQFQVQPATIVTSQGTCTYNQPFNVVSCQLGNIAATPVGQPNPGVSITFKYLVPAGTNPTIQFPSQAPSSNAIQNNATVTSVSFDPVQSDNTDPAWVDILALADVFVTKNCVAGPLISGAGVVFNYTISVGNRGPSNARNVRIVDVVPSQFNIVGPVVTSGPVVCSVTGNTVACNGTADLVPAGGAVQIQVFIPVTAAAGITVDPTVVNNTVTVSISTFENATTDNTAFCVTTIRPPPDVGVTKTGSVSTILVGNATTVYFYNITLTSNGPTDATGVTFNDTVPSPFVVTGSVIVSGAGVSFANNCAGSAGNFITCNFGTVAVGNQITITIPFTVPATANASVVQNCANVNAFLDTNPNNNQACYNITLTNYADVTVFKTTQPLCAGQSGVYVITVTNAGPAVANSVTLIDQLPSPLIGLAINSVTINNTCTLNATGFLSCNFGNLANGAIVVVNVAYTVPSSFLGSTISNTATVSTTSPEPINGLPNSNTNVVSICQLADVAIIKTGPISVVAGQSSSGGVAYAYTFSVTNNGPSDAADVSVSDVLPKGFTATQATATGQGVCIIGSQVIGGTTFSSVSCSWLGQLWRAPTNPGPRRTELVAVLFTVDESVPAGVVQNCATASTTTPDSNTGNNVNCTNTPVINIAPVTVLKTGPSACIQAGLGSGRYTITVSNPGPSRAYSVQLQDTIPAPFQLLGTPVVTGSTVNGSPSCQPVVGNVINCNFGDMRPSDSVVVTYDLTVPNTSSNGTNIENVAIVTYGCADGQCPRNSTRSSFFTNICATADLTIVKTAAGPFVAGLNAVNTFSVRVSNNGPAVAFSVTVADLGFNGGTITSITSQSGAQCSLATLSCFYPIMTVGQTDLIVMTVSIAANQTCGPYPNTATIASSVTPDPNGPNNSTVIVPVVSQHDLGVVKQGHTPAIAGGAPASFVVTVSNAGPSDATNVQFIDNVPLPLVVLNVSNTSPNPNACTFNGQLVTCFWPRIAANTIFTVSYGYYVPANATLPPVDPNTGKTTVNNTACVQSINTTSCESEINPSNACSTYTTEILCQDDLRITKTDFVDTIVAGNGVTYTFSIVVVNAGGPSEAHDVVVTDFWPSQYTMVGFPTTNVSGLTCTIQSPGFVCRWPRLAANVPVLITQSYTVGANIPPQQVTNTVRVDGSCSDLNTTTNVAIDTNTIVNNADMGILKDDCTTSVTAGGLPITYTFTVTNAGPSAGQNVHVVDRVPLLYTVVGDLTFAGEVTPSSCTWSQTLVGNVFDCTYASFPAGATAYVYLQVRVNSTVLPGFVTNCAVVTTSTIDPNPQNNEDCDTNTIINLADLSITKRLVPDQCIVAGNFTPSAYVVTVTNLGPSIARNVVVREDFPAGAQVISVPVQCTLIVGSNNYTCFVGDVAPGTIINLTFLFRVASNVAPGIIINHASVYSTTPDPDLCNNNVTLPSLVCAISDLGITKDDGYTVVTAGDGIVRTYNISGYNLGPSDAVNVVIDDIWPNAGNGMPGFTRLEINGAVCSNTPLGFVCTVGNVPVGGRFSICVSYTVDSCTMACELCNTVGISSNSVDPNPDNNVARDCNIVRTEADLGVCKSDGVDVVTAGDLVTYTYTVSVTNYGPSCAQKVTLVDHFPKQVFQLPGSLILQGPGSCIIQDRSTPQFQDFSCNLLTLQVNQTVTLFVSYTVPANVSTCSVTNVVSVSSITFDPVQCNNDAKDVNALIERSRLVPSKTSSADVIPLSFQGNNTFTITVFNQGPSTARDVVLTDLWPSSLCQYPESLRTSQGACITTGGDITCSFGDINATGSVTVTVPFSVCAKSVAGNVTNTVSAFSPTDEGCRSASKTITLVAGKKSEIPVVKRQENAVPVPHTTEILRRDAAPQVERAHFEIDATLPPMRAEIRVTRKDKGFKLVVQNPNSAPIKVGEVMATLKLKDGSVLKVDVTRTDRHIASSTCGSFLNRKLPKNWSEECFVTFQEKLEVVESAFVVAGSGKTGKGLAPVIGQSA